MLISLFFLTVIKSVPRVVRSWCPRGHYVQTLILMLWLVSIRWILPQKLEICWNVLFINSISGKIYPSRDEYEAHQERVLARISKHNNQQALSHSIEEGLKIQAMTRYTQPPVHIHHHNHSPSSPICCNKMDLYVLLSDYSVGRDTRWRTAVEQKIMETPPTVAMLLSTATRHVLNMFKLCVRFTDFKIQ